MGVTNKCTFCGQRTENGSLEHMGVCPARHALLRTQEKYGHTKPEDNGWKSVYVGNVGMGGGGSSANVQPKEVSWVYPPPPQQAMNHDLGKTRYCLVPARVSRTLAEIFDKGAQKYVADDWKLLTVTNRIEAAYRHINAFREGQRLDPQDAFHHLAMAASDLLMAMEIDLDDARKDLPR